MINPMATVILNHRVEDYKKWRPVFDADTRRRTEAGMKNEKVFRSADDPNNIYIIADVADPSTTAKMMNDPDLAAKMKEGGVISKPTVTVLNHT
jgi:hypothetical protein